MIELYVEHVEIGPRMKLADDLMPSEAEAMIRILRESNGTISIGNEIQDNFIDRVDTEALEDPMFDGPFVRIVVWLTGVKPGSDVE
jgi:hypothetical protein